MPAMNDFKLNIPLKLQKNGKPYPIAKKAPRLARGKFVAGGSITQQNHVRDFVAKCYGGELYDGPIEISAVFYLQKPKKPKNGLYPITN